LVAAIVAGAASVSSAATTDTRDTVHVYSQNGFRYGYRWFFDERPILGANATAYDCYAQSALPLSGTVQGWGNAKCTHVHSQTWIKVSFKITTPTGALTPTTTGWKL